MRTPNSNASRSVASGASGGKLPSVFSQRERSASGQTRASNAFHARLKSGQLALSSGESRNSRRRFSKSASLSLNVAHPGFLRRHD